MRSAQELFERSVATLVQSWIYLASGSPGAEVIETKGAAIALFVHSPDREFLNNALLMQGLGEVGATLDRIERAYAERGVEHFAIWVHESEAAVTGEILARGYVHDTAQRTMAMEIAELGEVDTAMLDLADLSLADFWGELGVAGMAPDLAADGSHRYVSRLNGENATTLMALDHDGDCGIYMVGTAPWARRRGLATALSAHAVAEAAKRGCATVSLQSTSMAEGAYARVGFRDLGRFDEYVPKAAAGASEGGG